MIWKRTLAPAGLVLLGLAVGYFGREAIGSATLDSENSFIERREGGVRYINPLLDCDLAPNVLKNHKLEPFREKVTKAVKSAVEKRLASEVSVYFRELNDGLWFSVGDTTKFVPASLRKVPLMIAILKMAESEGNQRLLDREVTFDLSRDYNEDQNIQPSQTMDRGKKYPVRELVSRMIVYSDNNAFTLLAKIVDNDALDRVYATLRIQNPTVGKDDDYLSVQTYASFLRVLYNATYLSKPASEWALGLLSQSEFHAGLVEGVPKGVNVAHKFGEHSDVGAGTVQLHDCGIVYYPNHPYLLCVMSKGPSFESLDDVIRDVSRIAFKEVDSQHRGH